MADAMGWAVSGSALKNLGLSRRVVAKRGEGTHRDFVIWRVIWFLKPATKWRQHIASGISPRLRSFPYRFRFFRPSSPPPAAAAMKDGKNESWWCDASNPMLTHGLYAVAASQLVFWLIHTVDQTNLGAFL